jgi:hypothetical protein
VVSCTMHVGAMDVSMAETSIAGVVSDQNRASEIEERASVGWVERAGVRPGDIHIQKH